MASNITELAGKIFSRFLFDGLKSDDSCLVLLTPELYAHFVKMYDNTDWEKTDRMSISCPDEDEGTLNNDAFKKTIGEYVYFSHYGSPVENIEELECFADGMTLYTTCDYLNIVASDLYSIQSSEPGLWFKYDLLNVLLLATKNGLNESMILKEFKDVIK